MKSFKNNSFVKIARGYVIFFYVCFPLVIIGKILQLNFGPDLTPQQTNIVLPNVDVGGFFGNEKFITSLNFGNVVLWLFILLVNACLMAGIFYGIIKLNKFLKNVYNDRPFIQENGKHLKVIGILIIVLSTLVQIAKNTPSLAILHPGIIFISIIVILFNALLNSNLAIGLVVFVIGEIIVRASEMKEEQDLTV